MSKTIAAEVIATRISEIRGKKVMLDRDLSGLYGVPVKVLNQTVKRNIRRFPDDFMFQLTWEELESSRSQIATLNSRSQFVTLKQGRNIKYLP
jgi:RNA binding exosome subunit